MTTKVISGPYAGAYKLTAPTTLLSIAATGYVEGNAKYGVYSAKGTTTAAYDVINDGTVKGGQYGVFLAKGGSVTNGDASDTTALIEAPQPIDIWGAKSTVTNFGSILGLGGGVFGNGVYLQFGGNVINGSAGDTSAEILGYKYGVAGGRTGTVSNYGTIYGLRYSAIRLFGGSVTNGIDGLIKGQGEGIDLFAAGKVLNLGTVEGGLGGRHDAIYLVDGGSVTNGSAVDTAAQIIGYNRAGVLVFGNPGTITNFGTILENPETSNGGYGVGLAAGGRVKNGTPQDTSALIEGASAVYESKASVVNYGTLLGKGDAVLMNGGTLINGGGSVRSALIQGGEGRYGINFFAGGSVLNFGSIYGGAAGSATIFGGVGIKSSEFVQNYGTIKGGAGETVGTLAGAGGAGVDLPYGGTVSNSGVIMGGSNSQKAGGGDGVDGSYATIVNLMEIDGGVNSDHSSHDGIGVKIISGSVTNGSPTNTTAIISGLYGVLAGWGVAVTVINFATIEGAIDAVALYRTADRLIVEANSTFIGAVKGGGGTLELNEGGGTLTGIGGTAALTGSVAMTLSGFDRYQLDAGASWTLASLVGVVTVANYGTLQNSVGAGVTLTNSADRLIAGAGSAFSGTVVGGGGTLELAGGSGTISGLGGIGTLSGSVSMTFDGFGGYVFDAGGSWTLEGSNTLAAGATVSNAGTLMVTGALVDRGSVINTGRLDFANGATLQAQGVLANSGVLAFDSATSLTDMKVLAGGATFVGGGTVALGGPKARIIGASAASVFTNVDNTIEGQGWVGAAQMTLNNEAKGVIEATGVLTVRDAAGQSVTNAGLIEASSTGKLALVSETINQAGGGTILAAGGLVTLQGVDFVGGTLTTTGAGRINVDGGGATLDGAASALTNGGLLQVTGGQTLNVDGAIVNSGKLNLHAAGLLVGAVGATLSGAGQINLNNTTANVIVGAGAGATLTNLDNRISGAGLLGDGLLTLVNGAAGQILGNQSLALTIDTGANTILNAGLIENTGKGGTLIKSAVSNTGTLRAATTGALTLAGTVTGAGVAQINGGTLFVQQAYAEKVTFTGSTGVLELGASQAFAGQVAGLSRGGTSWLDLADITFTSGVTKASYSGSNASGTLTVTDGAHTAQITLLGNYTASVFTVSTDGHGGTKVADPTAQATHLIQSTAAFSAVPFDFQARAPALAPLIASLAHAP